MAAPLNKQVFYTVKISGVNYDVTGRKRTPSGYIMLCVKDHPNCDMLGYVMEHRIMMEIELGRFLNNEEVVHHINEVKHDNRLRNLEVMDKAAHTSMHHTGAKRSEETRSKISEAAKKRLEKQERHPNYKLFSDEELKTAISINGPKYAAKILGITPKTMYKKMKEHNLEEWYENDKQSRIGR